ncbi:MAG: hypothetical protein WHS46_07115 [Desulfosoma sp.]
MSFVMLCLWTIGYASASEASKVLPREIAGYRLGTNVSAYGNRIGVDSVYTMRLRPYLQEAIAHVPEGFDSGYVVYGTCEAPGTIVRIKVKYENDSRTFFDSLLEEFRKQYGAPSQYVGDPFQAYVAWKWTFDASKDEVITMILSHYDGDDEEHTQGNALKLTLKSSMDRERRCYEARQEGERVRERREGRKTRPLELPKGVEAWRRYVPSP